MIVFCTRQLNYLEHRLPLERGVYARTVFSDAQIQITLETEVANTDVWVVGALISPVESLELFFLLNALQRAGARINLILTYFGYGQQDKANGNQSLGAEVMSNFLKTFALEQIIIIHPHSVVLQEFLKYNAVFPVDLISSKAALVEVIAAPDKGAASLVHVVSAHCNKQELLLTKMRPDQEHVRITSHLGDVSGKSVLLVDDIVTTGNTLVQAAQKLKELGATEIYAWATHALFAGDAVARIAASPIKKLYITNSVPQNVQHEKIELVDIAPLLANVIQKESRQ